MSEQTAKSFDCVAFMREARDRISREIQDMNHEELLAYFRSRTYTDPTLKRIAERFEYPETDE